MDPGRRPPHFWYPASDDFSQLLRTIERLQEHQRPPQFERYVRVGTDCPRYILFFRELMRLSIEPRIHAARVVNFDRVHFGQDFKQIRLLPATFSQRVKRMRDADK